MIETRTDDEKPNKPGSSSRPRIFEIQVKGHLDQSIWSDWLEGLEMKLLDNGEMILIGPVADQAALMGILNKLSRLNLALLSINSVEEKKGREEE